MADLMSQQSELTDILGQLGIDDVSAGGGGDALDAPNDDIFNLPTIVNNEVDNMFEELLMGDDGGATTTTDPVGGMGMMGMGMDGSVGGGGMMMGTGGGGVGAGAAGMGGSVMSNGMGMQSMANLPSCAQCTDPISGKCINALHKKWHPQCFVCAQCFNPFPNGQYYEFDALPYCGGCYTDLFGPRCSGCKEDITGRCVTALDQKWHPQCFQCGQCNACLAGGSFVEKEGKAYCKPCQSRGIPSYRQQKQAAARAAAGGVGGMGGGMMMAGGGGGAGGMVGMGAGGQMMAGGGGATSTAGGGMDPTNGMMSVSRGALNQQVANAAGDNVCSKCAQPVSPGDFIIVQGQKVHMAHFKCTHCNEPFTNGKCYQYAGRLYCEKDYRALLATCCAGCRRPITGRCITALGKQWHPEHFVCQHCEKPFAGGSFYEKDGRPYCDVHYHQLFGSVCAKCGRSISGRGITALNKQWHPEHFTCVGCDKALAGGAFCEWDQKPMCKRCFLKLPAHLRRKLSKKNVKKKK